MFLLARTSPNRPNLALALGLALTLGVVQRLPCRWDWRRWEQEEEGSAG